MAPRVFIGDEVASLAGGGDFTLPDAAARHVAQALRMRAGDPLALFTGTGGEYTTTIERIDRSGVTVRVLRHDDVERESPLATTLVQSLIAADMMDLVVRKAVELGVAAIIPVQSARSQVVPAARASRRAEHWRQIAIAACEQCGRNRVPSIGPAATFREWIDTISVDDRAVILDSGAARSLAALAAGAARPIVAVGPEGGFTKDELRLARQCGVVPAHLGRRALRSETAAIAALATLDAIAGDAR